MQTTPTLLAFLAVLSPALAQKEPPAVPGAAPSGMQGWWRTVDTLHHDVTPDGALWVRGADYKARFDPDGIEFTPFLGSDAPRNFPLRLRLRSATLDGRELPLDGTAAPALEGQVVRYDRGPLVERYRLSLDSIEQTFELATLDGLERGELVLDLALEGELVPGADGDGLLFSGPCGGVRYGGVTVVDAVGRAVNVPSRLAGGALRLAVPADFVRSAALPLVVDPVIATFTPEGSPGAYALAPDVAYDESNDQYLAVWQEIYSATDSDVYAMLLTPFGAPSGGDYIDFTTERWALPSVANCNSTDLFVVVAEAGPVGQRYIGRRTMAAGTGALGAQWHYTTYLGNEYTSPSIGGSVANGPVAFAVAYVRSANTNWHPIELLSVQADGEALSYHGPISGAGLYVTPHVSRTSGAEPVVSMTRWNIAWTGGQGGAKNVHYAQLVPQDTVFGPVEITSADDAYEAWPSPPLDVLAGQPEWAIAYSHQTPGHGRDVFCWLLRGTQTVSLNLISAMENAAWNEHQVRPSLDTDGTNFLLTYSESYQGSSGDYDVYAATLEKQGASLVVREPHVNLAYTSGFEWAPAASIAHRKAGTGKRGMVLWSNEASSTGDISGAVYELSHTAIGSPYCTPNANSHGYAQLRALGSARIADDAVLLDVGDLPLNQFGYMLMSKKQASIPVGQGILCLGSPQVRFQNDVRNSGSQGYVVFHPELSHLPQNTVVHPGETWFFQYWTRDGAQQNFSNGVRITFE